VISVPPQAETFEVCPACAQQFRDELERCGSSSVAGPAFFPNGRRIAYGCIGSSLKIVRANGRGKRVLVHDRALHVWWTPDSRRILYDG
jgi:hypothetical protein